MAAGRTGPERPLRLRAEDAEDLAVMAAVLQDAVVRVGDIAFLARRRQFAGVFTRFRWEALTPGAPDRFVRVRAGFHADTIRGVRGRNVPQDEPDAVLSLLTLRAAPAEAGVVIELVFSGDCEIRLDAECIDAHLSDFGQSWYTRHRPRHWDGSPRSF